MFRLTRGMARSELKMTPERVAAGIADARQSKLGMKPTMFQNDQTGAVAAETWRRQNNNNKWQPINGRLMA